MDHEQQSIFNEETIALVRCLLDEAERQQYLYERAISNYSSALLEISAGDSQLLLKYVEPKRRAVEKTILQIVSIINDRVSQGEPVFNTERIH